MIRVFLILLGIGFPAAGLAQRPALVILPHAERADIQRALQLELDSQGLHPVFVIEAGVDERRASELAEAHSANLALWLSSRSTTSPVELRCLHRGRVRSVTLSEALDVQDARELASSAVSLTRAPPTLAPPPAVPQRQHARSLSARIEPEPEPVAESPDFLAGLGWHLDMSLGVGSGGSMPASTLGLGISKETGIGVRWGVTGRLLFDAERRALGGLFALNLMDMRLGLGRLPLVFRFEVAPLLSVTPGRVGVGLNAALGLFTKPLGLMSIGLQAVGDYSWALGGNGGAGLVTGQLVARVKL